MFEFINPVTSGNPRLCLLLIGIQNLNAAFAVKLWIFNILADSQENDFHATTLQKISIF